MDQSIRLDDLSNAVGVPETTVHRAIIEMSENGFLTTSKDGRNLFALLEKSLRPPALLMSD